MLGTADRGLATSGETVFCLGGPRYDRRAAASRLSAVGPDESGVCRARAVAADIGLSTSALWPRILGVPGRIAASRSRVFRISPRPCAARADRYPVADLLAMGIGLPDVRGDPAHDYTLLFTQQVVPGRSQCRVDFAHLGS